MSARFAKKGVKDRRAGVNRRMLIEHTRIELREIGQNGTNQVIINAVTLGAKAIYNGWPLLGGNGRGISAERPPPKIDFRNLFKARSPLNYI